MLFKNKKCSNCGNEYDSAKKDCPNCGAPNLLIGKHTLGRGYVYLPLLKQLLFFIVGTIGLTIIATIFTLVSQVLKMDEETANSFTTFITYFIVFGIILYLIIKNLIYFKHHLKKIWPYLFGILGGAGIILMQTAYEHFLMLIGAPLALNENEELVRGIIISAPILSTLILGIMGPIVEETTYRLGLFSVFNRVNRVLAYIISSFMFALVHFSFNGILEGGEGAMNAFMIELYNLPMYIISGLMLSFIYDHFGIVGSSMAHIINNLHSIMLVLLKKEAL